jgi:CYTH domain-containing protein
VPEIERKFVVERVPGDIARGTSQHIRQGYLTLEPAEVRLRSLDDATYELAVKSLGGLRRAEVNLPLTADQFEELWPLVQRSIEKDRGLYEVQGGTAEVDVYHGKLAGLVVVEVEFPSETDAQAFTPPAWFGAEVTEDPRFRNVSLAVADEPPRVG